MKKLIFLTFALFLAACDGNKGGAPTTVATTPIDTRCYNGSTQCNNGVYNQYYGWSAYPGIQSGYNYMPYFSQYGFCNCPAGSQPAYNSTSGLGCVQSTMLYNMGTVGYSWNVTIGQPYFTGYNPGPQYPININQVSNVQGYPSNSNSCYGSLMQSCFVGQINACGVGAVCRPTMGNSGMGICTQ